MTAGGIPLEEVSPRGPREPDRSRDSTSRARVLDVVGHIGGYNFLWAWVSGRRAGEGAAGSAGLTTTGTTPDGRAAALRKREVEGERMARRLGPGIPILVAGRALGIRSSSRARRQAVRPDA